MNDAERVAKATRASTGRMLGPVELERCAIHPQRWRVYRWTWPAGQGPEVGDVQITRACALCSEDDQGDYARQGAKP